MKSVDERLQIIKDIARKYAVDLGHPTDSDYKTNLKIKVLSEYLYSGVDKIFGSVENLKKNIDGYISSLTINESLKYPNKAYVIKTASYARRRASPVMAENIDKILNNSRVFYLVDEVNPKKILHSELLEESEAQNRNKLLIDNSQPFRWLVNGQ